MARMPKKRLAVVGTVVTLASAATALAAFQGLPPGGNPVNDDAAAGLDPNRPVSVDDPTNADVVGGALTAGKPGVPWAVFRTTTSGKDQVFVRQFANGAWTTRAI